jgi:hypothetical protein
LGINGKFNRTKHSTIMEQLLIRAERFRKQGRLQEDNLEQIIREMKEEGHHKDSEETNKESAADNEHKIVMEAVEEGLLQVHGIAPNTKQPGIFRIMGENGNGFSNAIGGNNKIAKALDIKDDLNIGCLLYCEHRINFWHKDYKNDFKQMFQWELACTAVAAHNVHESKHAGRVQEGGTGGICFGDATGYIRKVGCDDEGLGQWSWILMGGAEGHKTRIITAYNPCKNKNVNSGTSDQQQRRYFIMKKKDLSCPLILFRKHLFASIKQWRAAGERIILFMDHNEHVIDGCLGKALANKDGPALSEAIKLHTGASPGATFFQGSRLIDGIWVSSDLDISKACVLPFGFGVADHRAFILDIPTESLVGGRTQLRSSDP